MVPFWSGHCVIATDKSQCCRTWQFECINDTHGIYGRGVTHDLGVNCYGFKGDA